MSRYPASWLSRVGSAPSLARLDTWRGRKSPTRSHASWRGPEVLALVARATAARCIEENERLGDQSVIEEVRAEAPRRARGLVPRFSRSQFHVPPLSRSWLTGRCSRRTPAVPSFKVSALPRATIMSSALARVPSVLPSVRVGLGVRGRTPDRYTAVF